MYRLIGFLIFALCIGCGRQAADPAAKGSKGTLAISVMTAQNPFFNVIAKTFKAEAEKAGYAVIVASGDGDSAKQHNQVKDFLVQKVRAIVLCPCDSRAIGAAIREANRAGVPVFTADLGCLDATAKVVAHIATDNYAGGKMAGEAMIEALGGTSGRIAILDYKEAESCILRVKGFKEVIAEYNQEHPESVIVIVAELPCGGDREMGAKATQTLITAYPNLNGLFAINDPSALGAHAALEIAKKADRVKIIGFDGQPEGKKAIKDGKIYADPIQYPDHIARATLDSIQFYLAGENILTEKLIPTGLYRKADADKDPDVR